MGVNSATDFEQFDNADGSQTVTESDVVDVYDRWLESVKFCVDDVCMEFGIDDLAAASQNRYEAVLKIVGRRLFRNNSELHRSTNYVNDNTNNNSVVDSSNNINYGYYYDIDKLYILLDLYYFLCGIYDKAVSVIGFSSLTGLSVGQYSKWVNGKLLTNIHETFTKTLKELRQESLTNILTTAKRNPVGLLGILNHEFNWSMPGVTKEKTIKVAVDASQLPDLGAKKQIETHGEQPQMSNILDTVKIKS